MKPRALLVAVIVAWSAPASAFVPPNHGPKITQAAWSGTWTTDYGTMHLTQSGAVVRGDYAYANGGASVVLGWIDGHVDGLVLRLRWSESTNGAGAGDATFTLSTDGQSFTGSWSADPNGIPGIWNGKRQ